MPNCLSTRIKPVHTYFSRRKEWSLCQMLFILWIRKKLVFVLQFFSTSSFDFAFEIPFALLWNENVHMNALFIIRKQHFCIWAASFCVSCQKWIEMKRNWSVGWYDFGRKEVFISCQSTVFGECVFSKNFLSLAKIRDGSSHQIRILH